MQALCANGSDQSTQCSSQRARGKCFSHAAHPINGCGINERVPFHVHADACSAARTRCAGCVGLATAQWSLASMLNGTTSADSWIAHARRCFRESDCATQHAATAAKICICCAYTDAAPFCLSVSAHAVLCRPLVSCDVLPGVTTDCPAKRVKATLSS